MDLFSFFGWLGGNRLGRASEWRAIAESARLTVVGTSSRHGIHARRGGLTVLLGPRSDAGGTRVEIRPIASGLSAWRVVDMETRLSGVETGDAPFDGAVRFSGPWLLVRALLDAETRNVARDAFLVATVTIRDGTLTADFGTTWETGQVASAQGLLRLLALAERVQALPDPVPRLAEIARSDREPVVRRSAVGILTANAKSRPETRQAQRAACLDADPSVRLAGARHLGGEGVPVLEELAGGRVAPDEIAAEAIDVLGNRLPPATLRAILDATRLDRPRTACAALTALGSAGPADVERITALLARVSTGPVALAAVKALIRTKAPAAAEAPLAAALGADVEVARAAAQGLARLGTVDSVQALRAAEGRPELARTAREAIASIHSRLKGASPGQLALTGASGGELAVAEGDGRVSLDPSRRGEGD